MAVVENETARNAQLLGHTWVADWPASMRMWINGAWLTHEDWRYRHHVVLTVLWFHVPALFLFGVFGGVDHVFTAGRFQPFAWSHAVLEVAIVALAATVASITRLPRRVRSSAACLGLISSSAILVHFSGGFVEAHFHFFVMVGLAALYVDYVPFLLAVLFVIFHHGVVGTLAPESVYNHAVAIAHPWRWATLHGLFVVAMAWTQLANMVVVGKKMQAMRLETMGDRIETLV